MSIPIAEDAHTVPDSPPPFRDGLFQLDPFALVGSQCSRCDTRSYPARPFCPKCRAMDGLDAVTLPTTGHVHTFTIVRQAPAGVPVPYVLARVELDDGTRLMAQVKTGAPDAIAIGDPVRLTPAVFSTQPGVDLGGYAFTTEQEEVS